MRSSELKLCETIEGFSLEKAAQVQEKLLHLYGVHQRTLPWRQTKDPYLIWVSEVMLQQTRVETVLSYYK